MKVISVSAGDSVRSMAFRESTEVTMNAQGRILVPRDLRRRAGLAPGDRLMASVENGALVFRGLRGLIDEVTSRYENVPGTSVDDLIAMRRADASRV